MSCRGFQSERLTGLTWTLIVLLYMGADGPLYAFSLFLPSIINQLGYRATPANLLSVPVYVVACVVTCAVALVADRYGNRGYLTMYVPTSSPASQLSGG